MFAHEALGWRPSEPVAGNEVDGMALGKNMFPQQTVWAIHSHVMCSSECIALRDLMLNLSQAASGCRSRRKKEASRNFWWDHGVGLDLPKKEL